jgi:hypothetical protein
MALSKKKSKAHGARSLSNSTGALEFSPFDQNDGNLLKVL